MIPLFCLFIVSEVRVGDCFTWEENWYFWCPFSLFSFSMFFHCGVFGFFFESLPFAAFPIISNVLQAPWFFLWWNQCHHLTTISYINDKGEHLTSCCLRFMLPAWGHKQKNGGISVDLLALDYFLFASGKLPLWTSFVLANSSETPLLRFCSPLNVPSMSYISTWFYLLTLLEESGKEALCITLMQMATLRQIHCQAVTKCLTTVCSCTACLQLAGSEQKMPFQFPGLKLEIGS